MARNAATMIAVNHIDSRSERAQFKDGNGDPIENSVWLAKITDLTRTTTFGLIGHLIFQGAPTTGSGTVYAGFAPGTKASDITNGVDYIKTSAVGATDVWVKVGTQT